MALAKCFLVSKHAGISEALPIAVTIARAQAEGMLGVRPNRHDGTDAVRVLVVDDHPALRKGLDGLLQEEKGFRPLGALPGADEIDRTLETLRPDVVILDYALEQ